MSSEFKLKPIDLISLSLLIEFQSIKLRIHDRKLEELNSTSTHLQPILNQFQLIQSILLVSTILIFNQVSSLLWFTFFIVRLFQQSLIFNTYYCTSLWSSSHQPHLLQSLKSMLSFVFISITSIQVVYINSSLPSIRSSTLLSLATYMESMTSSIV